MTMHMHGGRRGSGFTLTELMVVLAIVTLLMVMLLPTMSRVHALTRSSLCKGNLRRLGDAFAAAYGQAQIDGTAGKGSSTEGRLYPKPMSWPAVPRNVVDDAIIYHCPEGEMDEGARGKTGGEALEDMFDLLEYVCPYGNFPMSQLEGLSSFYLARTDSDEKGAYTDFMLQDDEGNGQLGQMDFYSWYDTDGFCRVYHSGEIHVFDRVPDMYGQAGGPGFPDRVNTCPDINIIHWRGEPAFGNEGRLRNHRGQTFKLDDWNPGYTNYGISSYSNRYTLGAEDIVLVDYEELIVEVDTPVEAEAMLLNSARHLGKVNYLRADGAVKSAWPMEVSPRLRADLWMP